MPVFCQHCDEAPCEPVCPVYATYHNSEGLNVQVYNRCIGTRFCANNCPYQARYFNFWEPTWPESLKNQLNPDVTVRSRGIMEKCTFCIQRIRRSTRDSDREGTELEEDNRALSPACVNACPTQALKFGDLNGHLGEEAAEHLEGHGGHGDSHHGGRGYHMLDSLGTHPNVIFLKKDDPSAEEVEAHG